MIHELTGDDCGVARNENHMVVEWTDGERKVVFSFCQHGKAIAAHFACDKAHRKIRDAIYEFVQWAAWAMPWCEYIVAPVNKPSVARLLPRVGFKKILSVPTGEIFSLEVP